MSSAYDYVIVGGGVAADSAAGGIRERDSTGSIAIISAEADQPYDRPPLSKDLWKTDRPDLSGTSYQTARKTGAQIRTQTRASGLDTESRTVRLDDGDAVRYSNLLIATGGKPRELRGLPAAARVVYFRTAEDYRTLAALRGAGASVLVVGGGFIASEIAAGLCLTGSHVTLLLPGRDVAGRVLPAELAASVTEDYRRRGVDVRTGHRVVGGAAGAESVTLHLDDGSSLSADVAVLGLGIAPSTEWLAGSGIALEADGGVRANAQLLASAPHVWAAGDVVSYPDALFGRRRVEHVDHAQNSGAQAGRNMAGAAQDYGYTPFFWSDLFDNGYEAIGDTDSRLRVAARWTTPLREGVVYYLDERGLPRGVLTWNTYDHMDAARALVKSATPIDPDNPPAL